MDVNEHMDADSRHAILSRAVKNHASGRDDYSRIIKELEARNAYSHPIIHSAHTRLYWIIAAQPKDQADQHDVRLEFEKWMKDKFGQTLSSNYDPYDDALHEMYWQLWLAVAEHNGY